MQNPRDENATPQSQQSLEGKVALVTAAAGAGIGQATAKRLAQAGADIALTDANEKRAREAAERIGDATGRRVVSVPLDVTSEAAVEAAIERTRTELGEIDILINNSGLSHVGPLWELTLESWQRVVDVCLTGHFLMMRAVLPRMIDQRSGSIVNISSIAGWVPWGAPGGEGVYHAAKAGVMALTRSTSLEVAQYNVRVNGVAPGLTPNPFLAKSQPDEFLHEIEAQVPLGRANQPEDIAECVLFLVSEQSAMITGETVNVSGGLFIRP